MLLLCGLGGGGGGARSRARQEAHGRAGTLHWVPSHLPGSAIRVGAVSREDRGDDHIVGKTAGKAMKMHHCPKALSMLHARPQLLRSLVALASRPALRT